jgi:hypothetical protein
MALNVQGSQFGADFNCKKAWLSLQAIATSALRFNVENQVVEFPIVKCYEMLTFR